jgi:hypothetical protein
MQEDLWKIGGVLIVGIFIIYLVVSIFSVKQRTIEGLENASASTTNGEAAFAANYAAALKAQTVQMEDALLISKYRKDYENVIINMDDYVNILMLKTILDIDITKDTKTIVSSLEKINTLSASKKSLNETMVFIDKQ